MLDGESTGESPADGPVACCASGDGRSPGDCDGGGVAGGDETTEAAGDDTVLAIGDVGALATCRKCAGNEGTAATGGRSAGVDSSVSASESSLPLAAPWSIKYDVSVAESGNG